MVKEMNRRIKGCEKFWSPADAEAMLQLKADTLCDSNPLEAFWKERHETRTGYRSCVGRRSIKRLLPEIREPCRLPGVRLAGQ